LADVDGVGLCVPGILNAERTAVERSVNVPALVGVSLARLGANAVGGSATRRGALVSDAHAAALHARSPQRPAGRLLCLPLTTGVGASVLDDGEALHVSGHSPGHIGQMDVSINDHPPIGPDSGRGSLEAYIGLPALRERYGGRVEQALAAMTIDQAPVVALGR